ncbi:MAG: polymorphic toxin-type HINT domain-containing protein, partial [Vicinamibacteria bacterium]
YKSVLDADAAARAELDNIKSRMQSPDPKVRETAGADLDSFNKKMDARVTAKPEAPGPKTDGAEPTTPKPAPDAATPKPADTGATPKDTGTTPKDGATTPKPADQVGPSGKKWDDPTLTEKEFIADYRARHSDTGLSTKQLKTRFKNGERLNPETGRLKDPKAPISPEGKVRDTLPTEGPAVEKWNGYERGGSALPCFPAATLVKTPAGDRLIEDLRAGDQVVAFDFPTGAAVPSTVTRTLHNRTQFLVAIETELGKLWSTRLHPFWAVDLGRWVKGMELKAGARLRTVDGGEAVVVSTEVVCADEATFNVEVEGQHNFFVASAGVLVHNGDEKISAFESQVQTPTNIYEVREGGKVVYVGKTEHGDVRTRLLEHVDDPNSALFVPKRSKLRKAPNFPDNVFQIKGVASAPPPAGGWTPYETAVWEQHFIDKNGGKAALRNSIDAITEDKFKLYRNLHNPCV